MDAVRVFPQMPQPSTPPKLMELVCPGGIVPKRAADSRTASRSSSVPTSLPVGSHGPSVARPSAKRSRGGARATADEPCRRPRVRIPFLSRDDLHRPIRDCVLRTAERTGMTPIQVARMMSYFFEEVIRQVTLGRVVRVPGVGTFGPKTRFRRVPSKFTGDLPSAYPAFLPSTSFKRAVRLRVPAALSPTADPMRKISNSYRKGMGRTTPEQAFENFRRALVQQNNPKRLARHLVR
jgi:nucleoid DNA-binding protein